MTIDFFILNLFNPETRFYYLAWVLTIIISITLHELAHGITAVRCGDDTPIRLNRMTLNPLVHMGPYSLLVLLLLGISWGAMPIDPTRLRGRYAEAKVAFAGPSVNLALALLCLTTLGIITRSDVLSGTEDWAINLAMLLQVGGIANLVLFCFNMLPVPPLDGAHILANFHPLYANFIHDPSKHGVIMLMFLTAWLFTGALIWPAMDRLAAGYLQWWLMLGR